MIKMVLNHRLDIPRTGMPEWVARQLEQLVTRPNPVWSRANAMHPWRARGIPQVLVGWQPKGAVGQILSMPRGTLTRVKRVLDEAEVDYEVDDQMVDGDPVTIPEHRIPGGHVLRPYQERIIASVIREGGGVVRSGTGSGKTSAALALAAKLQLRTLIVVWGGALFNQWIARIEEELRIPREDIGTIRGGKWTLGAVNVAMLQTLASRGAVALVNKIGVLVLDECQIAPAATAAKVIDCFPARYRLALSADERRKDSLEFLTTDSFGPVIEDVGVDELVAAGAVFDVKIRLIPTRFEAEWYDEVARQHPETWTQLLDEMVRDEDRFERAIKIIKGVAREGPVLCFSARVDLCRRVEARLALDGVACRGRDHRRNRARDRLAGGFARCAVDSVAYKSPTVRAGARAHLPPWRERKGGR
jgi:superfamily II DNA or RNA helicase